MTGTPGAESEEGPTMQEKNPIRRQYDWTEVPASVAVIETVTDATGIDATALDTLYECLDPDALDALVRSFDDPPTGERATVSFVFEGFEVTVDSDGEVVIQPTSPNE